LAEILQQALDLVDDDEFDDSDDECAHLSANAPQ
jgi:hypothetical protein